MGFLISSSRLRLLHLHLHLLLLLLLLLLTTTFPPVTAQPPPPPSAAARALDATLQDYAFRALAARPRTGIVYNATVPSNLTGIAASALRLRSGSLRRRGYARGYFQFLVPRGVVVQPHVERVVLVYHDLGDWSGHYYPPPPGYAYLAPVLGLLAYDAANLSAVGVPELGIVAASGAPISVAFDGVRAVPAGGGAAPRCVVFGLDGVPQFRDLEGTNVCTTYRQGHISIVVDSSEIAPAPAPAPTGTIAPAPAPTGVIAPPIPTEGGGKKGSSDAWKIAVGVVGGAAALGALAALLVCLVRYKRDKKLQLMERNAEVGETLRMAQVGRSQAPVAMGTRTQPVIENDYAA